MYPVEFYETDTGECPTREFLNRLNRKTELPYARRRIDLLKTYGEKLVSVDRTYAAYLKDHIFELRIRVRHKQFRILYFFFFNEKIILSHGIQKEDVIPEAEIDKAKKHREHYLRTHQRQI